MEEILGKSVKILRTFLEGEATDYSKYRNVEMEIDEDGEQYVKFILNEIEKKIGKKKFNWFKIVSRGNSGVEIRAFECSPTKKYFTNKLINCEVYLCSCGEKKHWGNVIFRKR